MVLIYTENEQLNRELNRKIQDSRIVYYPEYILKEQKATTLIATIQPSKYNFKDFMFKVREKNMQVILLLENEEIGELRDAIILGIYDIIFDPFSIDEVVKKINEPSQFHCVSKYVKHILGGDEM